jgi:hypothetical protein
LKHIFRNWLYFVKFYLLNRNNYKENFFINFDNEKYFELCHCEFEINNTWRNLTEALWSLKVKISNMYISEKSEQYDPWNNI